MNRIEYMTKLASLLQDIPEVERKQLQKLNNLHFVLTDIFIQVERP